MTQIPFAPSLPTLLLGNSMGHYLKQYSIIISMEEVCRLMEQGGWTK